MNLAQAVRCIITDCPAGSLFVEHLEGQISAESNTVISEDVIPSPGYVQVASCLMVWGMHGDDRGVEEVTELLVKMHNNNLALR